MTLDYPYTCPDLDKHISEAKDILYDYCETMIYSYNPVLEDVRCNELDRKIQDEADYLYEQLEGLFESCRTINENIREAADKQIEDLTDKVSDLEYLVEQLENNE